MYNKFNDLSKKCKLGAYDYMYKDLYNYNKNTIIIILGMFIILMIPIIIQLNIKNLNYFNV